MDRATGRPPRKIAAKCGAAARIVASPSPRQLRGASRPAAFPPRRRAFSCRTFGPSQAFLENPVAVIDAGSGQLGDRYHSLIVLEDPPELADLHPEFGHDLATRELDQHEGELAGHARSMELPRDAHQRHAGPMRAGLAQPPEQLGPAERE